MENHEHVREIEELRAKLEKLIAQHGFGLQRFAGSDEDIRFYTRCASYTHLMAFWHLFKGAAETRFMRVTSTNSSETSVTLRKLTLPSIDDLFLFMTHLSLGLKQKDLAHRFSIHQSTVSRIIISWANFLYCLLGSARLWIPKETIKAHLPPEFKDCPDTQVVIDCQTTSSLLLQSEVFSSYKSHCTFKDMLGMSPHM
ncbi:unnamed protein product [Oncorhynchus mykiss]|uniref:Transposase Helix-turn-helix domain-containing protein n=1 Tax=Oncorhynchus mykiss TaxID=8022 RepID=A0A060YNH6_ONCMY|nr:unnamed protein product [Oncorhynchus mykiss]